MPNYYAHMVYGEAVYHALSAPMQAKLENGMDAYLLGLFGPDPFLFLISGLQQARKVHRGAGKVTALLYREAAAKGVPMALEFGAGFLCHFALDCACHPFVLRNCGPGQSHAAMETSFDRMLMLRDGIDPHRHAPLPRIAVSNDLCRAAVLPYDGKIAGWNYRVALAEFFYISRFLTQAQGTMLRRCFNTLSRLPWLEKLQGAVPDSDPSPALAEINAELLRRLEKAVEPCARLIETVFEGDGPLPAWLERNYYGKIPGQE
jgi:hypothetical protein